MEKKKPRHLTATGKLKPSVRLASRNVKIRGVMPTVISKEWANRMHEDFSDLLTRRSREKEFLAGLSLNIGPMTALRHQSDLQKTGYVRRRLKSVLELFAKVL